MLIPFGNCIELNSSKGHTFSSIKLSPDGRLYAVATEKWIQIWSAGPEIMLLCQLKLQNTDSKQDEPFQQVQLVWKYDSLQLAAISNNGIINIFNIDYEDCYYEKEDAYPSIAYLPSCKMGITIVRNLSEFGSPLSSCSLEKGFVIGTSTGNLVEVEWNGISRGYPIVAPIMIYLPELAKDLSTTCQIHSVDYNSTLKVISVVIDSGSCILFHIAYTNRINFTGGFVVNAEHCVCACMGSFSHLLAIAHQSGEISIHRLSWVNDSLMPRPEYHFNIHRYDDLYPPPIENYHTQITCLAWNWENDHLAVGYADRCLAVWNLQENPVFWYSWKHHDSSIQIQSCCFSAMGDCILFNGGYVENTTISNTLLTQQFLITKPTQICNDDSVFTGYNSKYLFYADSSNPRSIFPISIPIAQSFLYNCNWPIVGMENNHKATHFLFYTCNDLCFYYREVDKWIIHPSVTDEFSYISSACWIGDNLIAFSVGSVTTPTNVTIHIYDVESMKPIKEMKLVGSTTLRVNEMVFDSHYLICLLNTAISIYTFSSSTSLNQFILTSSQTIPFSMSTSIPSHLLPIVGKLNHYESIHQVDSLEIFGVGKDQIDDDDDEAEEIEEEKEEELLSLLLLNHDYTADVLSIKTQERKPLSDDVLSVFLVHSSTFPSFASTSIILYGKHRYNTWFPLLEPNPQILKSWIGPKQYQFASIPFGFIPQTWSSISFYNPFYRHNNEGEIILETTCLLNSPLLVLLQSSHLHEANLFLQVFYQHHIPNLLPSLEFMIHSALNYSTPSILHTVLQFLSSYPIFPQILIGCLRKQERTTWPRALTNPFDILYLFRIFMNAGETHFASLILSVLQGVDCKVSETFIPPPSSISQLSLWCDPNSIKQHIQPSFTFLMESFEWIWTDTTHETECIAHKAGIELLLVLLCQQRIKGISDVYRFIIMEENRHEEMSHSLPEDYQIDNILSKCVLLLFEKGMLAYAIELQQEIGFSIKDLSNCDAIHVKNFADVIQKMMISMNLPLPPQECFQDLSLFKEVIHQYHLDRSVHSIQRLIERMEGEEMNEWKLVLYFITIDLDVLLSLAKQSSELWNRCIVDFQQAENKWYCNLVSVLQQVCEDSIMQE